MRKYGAGKDVFEAGCGTGLLLREAALVARSAVGLDLSRGMLAAGARPRAEGRAGLADRRAAAVGVVRRRVSA